MRTVLTSCLLAFGLFAIGATAAAPVKPAGPMQSGMITGRYTRDPAERRVGAPRRPSTRPVAEPVKDRIEVVPIGNEGP